LLYATPSPSQAAETKDQSTQATDNTAYDDDDEIIEAEGEKTTKRFTIHAKDRLSFEVDFQLYREFGVYQLRPRTKRSFGNSRISWIFQYGVEVEELQAGGEFGGRYWICQRCHNRKAIERPLTCGSTSTPAYHLQAVHQLGPQGSIERTKPSKNTVTQYFKQKSPPQPAYAERFQQKLINAMVECDLTFHQIASQSFRQLLLHSGPDVEELLPVANTARAWILQAFGERRSDIKSSLRTAKSRIAISFDSWSSGNDKHLLGIVGHWLDKSNTMVRALLAMPELFGNEGGAHIAPALQQCINYYEIGDKLGAFQMDNADNNDTAIKRLAELYPIDVNEQRLRCFGHIVNLVVKALLFGEGLSTFQKQLAMADDAGSYKLWRKQGAIGKLHNLVVYICRSGKRLVAFNKVQQEVADEVLVFCLKLQRDTGVRWNSVYKMIKRALQLERAITMYCARWQQGKDEKHNLKDDELDTFDWEELRHFKQLLKPFYKVTKRVEGHAKQGSHGAVWEVLPGFEYLFNALQRAQQEVNNDPSKFTNYYASSLDIGFTKLQQYYDLTDRSTLYRAAVALHPAKRFCWFETCWTKQVSGKREVANAKTAVRRLWRLFLEEQQPIEVANTTSPQRILDDSDSDDSADDEAYRAAFSSFTTPSAVATAKQKELEREREFDDFQKASIELGEYRKQPLRWWIEKGSILWPTLARLAFDLFAIPGMSAECERVFSQAKKMVTEERYNLKADVIEADQCLKSWLRNNIVDGSAMWRTLEVVATAARSEAEDEPYRSNNDILDDSEDDGGLE